MRGGGGEVNVEEDKKQGKKGRKKGRGRGNDLKFS